MRVTIPNPLGPPIAFDTANLPSSSAISSALSSASNLVPPALRGSRRAPLRFLILLLGLAFVFTFSPSPPLPPSYGVEWKREKSLPWTYTDAVYPEGRDGRYLKFDTPKATGFNYQLQRQLLQHHLAILGNRSIAYDPFVQDETSLPFKLTAPPWRSATIPLSAFISTVISGFERFYDTPRAVPVSHYRKVCPPYKQHVYTLKNAQNPDGDLELLGDGQARVHQLQVTLAGSDHGCVRVQGAVFDDEWFDSEAPLQMYETFAKSPVLAQFTFSSTVLGIINRVMPQLAPESALYNLQRADSSVSSEPKRLGRGGAWRHVLALHLRKGNGWSAYCDERGKISAPFVAFNKLPRLPGNENIPPPPDMVEATRVGLYRAKCDPQILDIIARARRMRKNHPLLKSVYILTDADRAWAEEVRMWLLSEGWDKVWVGREDLYPAWQDREVGVAVDMEVARRAGVFVGNGFSTTSSNIVLLRSRDEVHPDLTQFW